MSKFYEFWQNNSGGSFIIDDALGIGPRVWIEADDKDEVDAKRRAIGIYYNGVYTGDDCPCCGDRWNPPWGSGQDEVEIDPSYDFNWHGTVYVHRKDGTIERRKKGEPDR